jgi:hypothetical protein
MSQPEMIRVTNNRPTLLHGPDQLRIADIGDVQRFDFTSVGTGITFQPGGNNVERKAWEVAKKNRTVRSWLQLNWLSEGGDVNAPEGVAPPETLSNYNESAAVALVEMEGDLAALQRWKGQEERAVVKTAITKKLDSLSGKGTLRSPRE